MSKDRPRDIHETGDVRDLYAKKRLRRQGCNRSGIAAYRIDLIAGRRDARLGRVVDLLSQRTEVNLRQGPVERRALAHQCFAAVQAENEGTIDRVNLCGVDGPNPELEVPRQYFHRVRMAAHDHLVADTQRLLGTA